MTPQPIPNFGGDEVVSTSLEDADIVIQPLCYESAPSYGTGSKKGPDHILEASIQLERLDEETLIDWGLFSIHTRKALIPPADPEQAVAVMRQAAADIMARGKRLLSLGGDHAVSIGPIQAAADHHPNLGVLQVDAHMDLRDHWNGTRYNHACVMRRVSENDRIPIVQVGIRAFSTEEWEVHQAGNFTTLFAHHIDPVDLSWVESVVAALPENVYITIDLDGLDPSALPGTGTPEPGGISYRQLNELIKQVGNHRNVVAADITELAKIEGSQVSEYTAAKIASKLIVHCLGSRTQSLNVQQ